MDNYSANKGLSLIGTVVAVSILATSVLAVGRLMVARKDVVGLGRERLIAISLAREGLELIRARRDTNWITSDFADWQGELCLGGPDFTIDARSTRGLEPLGDVEASRLYLAKDGEWVHDPAVGESTIFSRTVTIDCSQVALDPEVMAITSHVTWNSREKNYDVSLQEKLFNWWPQSPTPSTPAASPTASPL